MKHKRILIWLSSLCFFLLACVRNPVTGKREFHMISEKAEIKLGQETKNAIVKEYGLYLQPSIQSYINEVGQKIVSVCDRKNIPYEFIILDSRLVNAFAVPGFVFLTYGILELIDDEAELAAVIGHEIGHITGFHAVKLIQKAFGYQFLSTFSTVALALYGPRADDPRAYAVFHQATHIVAASFLSGYGREFELESDRSGLRYAFLAGYDPEAMISFFKRMHSLGEENVSGIATFLRTHPPTAERIKQVRREIDSIEDHSKKRDAKLKSKEKVAQIFKSTETSSLDHFERYQEIVRSMPKMEMDQPGIIQGNRYEHPSFGIRLEVPKRWKLENYYGKSLVNFFSSDGKAQGELQMKKLQADPITVAENSSSFAGSSVSTEILTSRAWAETIEEGLKLEKKTGRDVVYPAGPSYIGTYRGRDRLGRPAHFKILFIVRGNKPNEQEGFVLSCATTEDSYLDYLVEFEQILKSFNWVSQTDH